MSSRLGTPYQQQQNITDNYSILVGDDMIVATSIVGGKTATLPDPATCIGDNGKKVIANLATSGGTLTLATAAGVLVGASSLAVGEAIVVNSNGLGQWTAESKFSAEGLTSGTISTADSKGVSAGTRASIADSKAVSDSLLTSTADSKGVSAGTGASVADSKAVSDSVLASTADSKGVSAGTGASVADSKAVSGSVNTSTALSTATSAAASNSANISVADSKGVSDSVVISSLTSRVSSKGG